MRVFFSAVFSALLTTAAVNPANAAYQIGDVVDNFTLVDLDGISRSLYDYKGKIIVLNFGEYWCSPCIAEWSVMTDQLWDPNKDSGVMVFTIGSDNESSFRSKANLYGGGWPWIFDPTGNLYSEYGNGYVPYNVVIDQDFRLAWGEAGWFSSFDHMQDAITPLLENLVVHRVEPNSVTASAGDFVTLDVSLENLGTTTATATAEVDAILVRGTRHREHPGNPMEAQKVRLHAGETRSQTVRMQVPPGAPAGDYFVRVGVGGSSESPAASDVMHLRVE